MKQFTLGSLFDGSGGFPLGAFFSGIEPLWASEIEPFPIRVTTRRLPQMKHLGDISRINGAEIEPVDIITFGSPCTDMSVAGKRAGLDGKQSILFYEAIRIIKEMRCATNGRYPGYIVWENVPGAFSSCGGRDFQSVLQEIVRVKDETAAVPLPEDVKWLPAGEIVGEGYSVAWRTLDAQYFGVAQRRRRCYLVADFAGARAGEILFESEGLSGYPPQSAGAREGTAADAERCVGTAICFEPGAASRLGGHSWQMVTGALRADMGDNQLAVAIENHPTDGRVKLDESGKVQTLTGRMGTGGGNVPLVLKPYGICSDGSNAMLSDNPYSGVYEATSSRTLDANGGNPSCNQGGIAVVALQGSMIGREDANGPHGAGVNEDVSFTLNTVDRHAVAYAMTTGSFADVHRDIAPSIMARDYKDPPVVTDGCGYVVRRLTPSECAQLQGFPTDWCESLGTPNPTNADITWWADVFESHRRITGNSSKPRSRKQIIKWLQNPHSDAAEYKMWGNGVALPCVVFVLRGIVQCSQGQTANLS